MKLLIKVKVKTTKSLFGSPPKRQPSRRWAAA
jgi:hypothetical protein